ncbi:MAG: sn-glycerol-3-phosphate ABC transporter ATP-binding protein UgpC [Gemmatimonadales bacterium]|nr:sn-glycerol-3-phosphate ABC transporter ATP-binding protein UgpC [Gemmatimonadales bacterium]NIN12560.1 sn-glycerol-3-phosphate ABC transporter ATP-binding protein UgpC [Gemmatimonadales bacterium]NIR03555.1 sn-glycerol-3-phosphate ABC transporter ATP-binding protein UgpC [Gemmatimonadales bacterium]NIS65877.1 sn-glycerol-3-phosphate ABC transporter ATP-binding protein UgpC [Gemmatimonadales bacterium]
MSQAGQQRSPDTSVSLVAVEKYFGDVPAIRSLSIEVDSGEFVVLVGPSGCGKTTALRMIAGLEEPTSGEIHIGGHRVDDVEPADRNIAMVFQNYALYPHMSARQNLGFGLKMRKLPREEIDARVRRAAEVLGLAQLLDRRPAQLSGGQRQRVALGRALVREPSVFLFDEPLSNLDARLRVEMRAEIADLHRRLGTTMIFVTHDQVEAMTLGQRIAVLNEGALQQYAAPLRVYQEPANLFVATFIGTPTINTIEGQLATDAGRSVFRASDLTLAFPDAGYTGAAAIGVRPEGLELVNVGASDADLRSTVNRLEPLGNELLVYLDGPGERPWVARVNADSRCTPGELIGIRLDRRRIHLFGGEQQKRLATGTVA